jgi:transcriptional regulator with XRE-family HTH domain
MKKTDFVPAKKHATITTGEVIRMLRELKGWTQEELSLKSGINAKNISLLENNKVEIGKTCRTISTCI